MRRLEVHFSGRVQGVGFRHTTKMLARPLAVNGYVQNLQDGRVRMIVEGEADQPQRLLVAVQTRMGANISHTQVEERPATGEFADFNVRY